MRGVATKIITVGLLILPFYTLSYQQFPYEIYLDHKQSFHLSWSVDYPTDGVYFKLTILSLNNSWFGFGFSDYGELSYADLFVIWRDKHLRLQYKDAVTDYRGFMHVDDHQITELVSVTVGGDGREEIVFYRKIDNCDHHYVLDNGTTHLVYVQGLDTINSIEGINCGLHNHGHAMAQILKPNLPVAPIPNNTWLLDIFTPSVTIPPGSTYWFYTTKIPKLSTKQHIVKFEGVIKNPGLIHHIKMTTCPGNASSVYPLYRGIMDKMPKSLKVCGATIGLWSFGEQADAFPEVAGLPIGGNDRSRYILTQIHYMNVENKKGLVDTSGVRFTISPVLRKYDIGIIDLGSVFAERHAIPPGQLSFPSTGFCVPQCTAQVLPPDGVKVFATHMHTHTTGRQIYIKHVRDGHELPEIGRDNRFHYMFQEYRLLEHPATILPGDALIHTCVYDTLNRKTMTLGGLSAPKEMCLTFIFYYPLVDWCYCKSAVDVETLDLFFGEMNGLGDHTQKDKSSVENFNEISWTPEKAARLADLYKHGTVDVQCFDMKMTYLPGNWTNIAAPETKYSLLKSKHNCTVPT